MVDLRVARVVGGVERAVEPVTGELGLGDLGCAGAQEAVDADVLGLALGVRIVGEAADGDAVGRRAVAADAVDDDAERLGELIQARGEDGELADVLDGARVGDEARPRRLDDRRGIGAGERAAAQVELLELLLDLRQRGAWALGSPTISSPPAADAAACAPAAGSTAWGWAWGRVATAPPSEAAELPPDGALSLDCAPPQAATTADTASAATSDRSDLTPPGSLSCIQRNGRSRTSRPGARFPCAAGANGEATPGQRGWSGPGARLASRRRRCVRSACATRPAGRPSPTRRCERAAHRGSWCGGRAVGMGWRLRCTYPDSCWASPPPS